MRCCKGTLSAIVTFVLFVLLNSASAQTFNKKFMSPYCTEGNFPGACTKTLLIYNDYDYPIYPVIQGTLEKQLAKGNCPEGDTWLQAAFGNINKCYKTIFDYHVYVNGIDGIPAHSYASVKLPWWSKRQIVANDANPDEYIDWWRAARIYIFDDQKAANKGFEKDKNRPVTFAAGSPIVTCDKSDSKSVCKTTIAYQACDKATVNNIVNNCAPGTETIVAETPQQLNEYTLASVDPVEGLTNFNENYNVSNVDQVYLPIAIEPLMFADPSKNNDQNTPGYLGTISKVDDVRTQLMAFTGATGSVHNPQNPKYWPIYTVEMEQDGVTPAYPMAGIRVPGAANIFNFLAQPGSKILTPSPTQCVAPSCNPTLANGPPWTGTTLVDSMIKQWLTCVTTPTAENCPQSAFYLNVDAAFKASYSNYQRVCSSIPDWLKPANASTPGYPNPPGYPNLYPYLQFVYGWVPFNVSCANADLPTGELPRQYIRLEDNFAQIRGEGPFSGEKLFNPYAYLVHGSPDGTKNPLSPPVSFGLNAATYAYSIDDQSSFLSYGGIGLIFDVGGSTALPNKTRHIFPPPVDPNTDIQLILAPSVPQKRPAWSLYSLCAPTANSVPRTAFTNAQKTDANGGYQINIPTDVPEIWKTPCYVTIVDAANQFYVIEIDKTLPWPDFNNQSNKGGFDHSVIACPKPQIGPPYKAVPADANNPNTWCGALGEVANKVNNPPQHPTQFSLSTRPPEQL